MPKQSKLPEVATKIRAQHLNISSSSCSRNLFINFGLIIMFLLLGRSIHMNPFLRSPRRCKHYINFRVIKVIHIETLHFDQLFFKWFILNHMLHRCIINFFTLAICLCIRNQSARRRTELSFYTDIFRLLLLLFHCQKSITILLAEIIILILYQAVLQNTTVIRCF